MKQFRFSGEITGLRDRHESTKPFGFKKVVIRQREKLIFRIYTFYILK